MKSTNKDKKDKQLLEKTQLEFISNFMCAC